MPAIAYEKNLLNNSLNSTGILRYTAQTFTPTVSHVIERVDVLVSAGATPPGIINVTINNTTGDSKTPDIPGVDLATGSFDGDLLPTQTGDIGLSVWQTVTLTGSPILTAGTTYTIALIMVDEEGGGFWFWNYDSTFPDTVYEEGGRWTLNLQGSSGWQGGHTNFDMAFIEYGVPLGGDSSPWPDPRSPIYEPDPGWDPTPDDGGDGEWTTASDIIGAGGGRHRKQLVAIGHNVIYYGGV